MLVWIAHVPYEHRGGEDVHVEGLIRIYRALGHETLLIPQGRSFSENTLGITARSLGPVADLEEWDEMLAQHKPAFIHVHNLFPRLGPRFLKWIIKKRIPTVMTVHNHRFYCTNGIALRGAQVCKKCKTNSFSGWPMLFNCNSSIKKSLYHTIARLEIRHADLYRNAITRFIAPSPYIAAELKDIGIDSQKIDMILNPVNALQNSEIRDVNEYDVIYAGRMSPEKGIEELLNFSNFRKDLKFVIIGQGPLSEKVQAVTTVQKNVRYIPQCTHEEVLKTIQRSRVGILTSICNEILPTFVLECISQGKPCVVPDSESTRWLGENPWGCTIAQVKSPASLSEAYDVAKNKVQDSESVQKIRQSLSTQKYQTELSHVIERLMMGR